MKLNNKKLFSSALKVSVLVAASVALTACGVRDEPDANGTTPVVSADSLASIDATPAFIQRGCGVGGSPAIYCPFN